MKVAIIGSRGIPAVYGGFETFAEELSVRLSNSGIDVTVVCEHAPEGPEQFREVSLLYSKYTKWKNPLLYYLDAARIASAFADAVIVCGVGGAIFYPMLSNRKYQLITHVDGREELRGKYSSLKKLYVRIAQAFAVKFSDHLVADSSAVMHHWKERFGIDDSAISVIEFGADTVSSADDSVFRKLGLSPHDYYLVVCRMVPENNLETIINGFLKSGSVKKLVLAGDLSGAYGAKLKSFESGQLIFTGGIYNRPALFFLRKYCRAYIHGHSVGGTNPSLLEAMAAGNICICHDNEFNLETTAGKMLYFKSEDDLMLRVKEVEQMDANEINGYAGAGMERIANYYNWDRITGSYLNLLKTGKRK